MTTDRKLTSVLIVGAGEFGATTALSLLKSGRYSVTLIDRAHALPAEDAASTDINKIVRSDYGDPDYMHLGQKAIALWQKDKWKGIYHQSGTINPGLGGLDGGGESGRRKLATVGAVQDIKILDNPSAFALYLDPESAGISAPQRDDALGYFNPVGGWVDATAAMKKVYADLAGLGCVPVPGVEVVGLIIGGVDVKGVKCKGGRNFMAEKVVIATGSWTPTLIEGLIDPGLLRATGVCVAAVQLDAQEREAYAKVPVILETGKFGFYTLPPNTDGLFKFVFHHFGYITEDGKPRTALTPGAIDYHEDNQLSWMTRDCMLALRQAIARYYPKIATKPLAMTRMCWYSETSDENWLIDVHPSYPSLFIATGGSGHAFKFLPIMGDLVKDRLEGTLDLHLQEKWGFECRSGSSFIETEGKTRFDIRALARLDEV